MRGSVVMIYKPKRQYEIVYYESIKRELKTRPIYECRCDERLKTKTEESTRLVYTRLFVELEHLKIETRLIDETCSKPPLHALWHFSGVVYD